MSFYFYEVPSGATSLSTVTLDIKAPVETVAAHARDSAAPAEWHSLLSADRLVPVGWAAGVPGTAPAPPLELNTGLVKDQFAAIETGGTVSTASNDAISALEWGSSRATDAFGPIAWSATRLGEALVKLDAVSSIFQDGIPALEWLQALAKDGLAPIEIGTSITGGTLRYADRVLEIVTAPIGGAPFAISETATWQTSGPASGFQTFGNIPNIIPADIVYSSAWDSHGNAEVGLGTWNFGSLARTTILASSNGGAAVSFVGSVTVICTVPSLYFTSRISDKNVETAGSTQATATLLTAVDNIVTIVTPGANDVTLNVAFDKQTVVNACGTGQVINLWPPNGGQIDQNGINNPVNINDGSAVTFYNQGNGTWNGR